MTDICQANDVIFADAVIREKDFDFTLLSSSRV